jgi:subtilisin
VLRRAATVVILFLASAAAAASLQGYSDGPANNQWALDATGITQLHREGAFGQGVRIALLDTGFDLDHASLRHIRVLATRNFFNESSQITDENGHGTLLLGLLAAQGAEIDQRVRGHYVKGIAPKADYILIRALEPDGSASAPTVAAQIDFAVKHGADIICMPFGFPMRPPPKNASEPLYFPEILERAISDAWRSGAIIVAAAGNVDEAGRLGVDYPANRPGVVGVGAVGRDLKPAEFSVQAGSASIAAARDRPTELYTFPLWPDVGAPGVNLLSTQSPSGFGRISGTSAAATFTCGGLAAALSSVPPGLRPTGGSKPAALMTGLYRYAQPIEGQTATQDARIGHGLARFDGVGPSVALFNGRTFI